MAEQPCLPQIQAVAMRIARLDGSGVPKPGANNLYVTDALTEMTVTPNYEDGDKVTVKNAAGSICINHEAPPNFLNAGVELKLCTPDPYVEEMLSGGTVLTSGTRKGFAAPAIGPVGSSAVSIELWVKRIDDGDLDASSPYAWYVYPKVKNLKMGSYKHENGAILPVFTGTALENANWFDGPLNNWDVSSDRCFQWFPCPATDVPTAQCGYITLAAS